MIPALARFVGPGAAMVAISLTSCAPPAGTETVPTTGASSVAYEAPGGLVSGRQFELRGTVSQLSADKACYSAEVARLCGYDPEDVIGSVIEPEAVNLHTEIDECVFTGELSSANGSVHFKDNSPESQICGTRGAEAALVGTEENWNVYCGRNVVEHANLVAPDEAPIEQVLICFIRGACRASSESAVEAACAALGTDVVLGENIEDDGSLNICACPGAGLAGCSGEACFTDPNNGDLQPATDSSSIYSVETGLASCKSFCKSTTSGTGSAYESCVKACKQADN